MMATLDLNLHDLNLHHAEPSHPGAALLNFFGGRAEPGCVPYDVHLGFLPGVPCDLNHGSGRAHLNPPNSGGERS